MKPEIVVPIDETKYVYAICRCPLDSRYAIKIKRQKGVNEYNFKCDICGTSGVVVSPKGE